MLVIEDDAKTRETIALYLAREGFQFTGVADGPSGLAAARAKPPDLVVLDLMLPCLDGLAVCRELRRASAVPIIMLTARTTDADVQRGLDLGADDYVAKPFSPRTLVARIRAVLRRTHDDVAQKEIAVGSLLIDRARHVVTVRGAEVPLTRTEFRLLTVLAESPGRVFSRTLLVERVLGIDTDTAERTIDAHVMKVRRKLQPHAGAPVLATVFGVGYRLESPA